MSSQPHSEPPDSSSRHRVGRERPPTISFPGRTTDDTPTIISRHSPLVDKEDLGESIRGRTLAHFELIEPIGVGGMAAVLRARDTQLDRCVALKILPPEMACDPENVQRFHQEARSAAKLDHENIARVFYCGEDQRLHFIAFEFVEGETLRALLEKRGRLPVGEALHYMLQVAAGLAHAAQRGVVHRDIKPSNIIVTPAGRAKLVDMGLARSLEKKSELDLTQSGVTLGTFDYISPEQALEPREADARSDIYSLGCTFYHILTGRTPVPEGNAAKKLQHHQQVKPIDPRQFVPDLPVEVVLILDRMMAKNPRDRFQSPEDLVHQLLVAARKLGVAPEVPEGVLTVETALPGQPPRRPFLWGALAVAAVIALVLLVDQAPRQERPRPGQSRPVADDNAGNGAAVRKGLVPNTKDKPTAEATAGKGVAIYTSPREPSLEDLAAWLKKNRGAARIELRLAGELDLTRPEATETRGLLVEARQKVVIRARDPGGRPTIRLGYDRQPETKETPAALTIRSRESLIDGVRFVVDLHAADAALAALLLRGGTSHEVRNCEFVQVQL